MKGGKIKIHQKRPYYIWIFGKDAALNKYFPEDYLKKLPGFQNFARFRVLGKDKVPYETTPNYNSIGRFRTSRENRNILTDVEKRRGILQFSFATDYSKLPYSKEFLRNKNNYEITNPNYEIVSIEPVNKNKLKNRLPFNPTDIITVKTTKDPYGDLAIILKPVVPYWIEKTHTEDDSQIKGDSEHTFGFKYLLGGITEAYQEKNKGKNIAKFEFEINK